MVQEGSYDINDWEEFGKENPEIMRLKTQMEITYNKEKILWDNLGLKDGMKILEPGSGPGWLTKQILRDYPNSEITCVEVNPTMHEYFNQIISENEKPKAKLVGKSIVDTGLEPNQFDFAIVRAILQHVPQTDEALKEITRLLKPNGVIYILDKDAGIDGIFEPELEMVEKIDKKFTQMQLKMGGHPFISRYLPRKLKNLGYRDVDFHMIAFHSDIAGRDILEEENKKENYTPLIKNAVLTESEVEGMVDDFQKWLSNPNSITIGAACVTVGIKQS